MPGISAEFVNKYCLYVRWPISQLPQWDEKIVQKAAAETAVTEANRLQMGRFHSHLPANVALTAVLKLLNLKRFGELYRAVNFVPGDRLQEKLYRLTI